mmetsp:Transcript_109668/g.318683  ORF Transcript_109668/g.318683 Transcript_109668/m.318683 type:complete len:378 (-) Transcript_109668:63-1196(-)
MTSSSSASSSASSAAAPPPPLQVLAEGLGAAVDKVRRRKGKLAASTSHVVQHHPYEAHSELQREIQTSSAQLDDALSYLRELIRNEEAATARRHVLQREHQLIADALEPGGGMGQVGAGVGESRHAPGHVDLAGRLRPFMRTQHELRTTILAVPRWRPTESHPFLHIVLARAAGSGALEPRLASAERGATSPFAQFLREVLPVAYGGGRCCGRGRGAAARGQEAATAAAACRRGRRGGRRGRGRGQRRAKREAKAAGRRRRWWQRPQRWGGRRVRARHVVARAAGDDAARGLPERTRSVRRRCGRECIGWRWGHRRDGRRERRLVRCARRGQALAAVCGDPGAEWRRRAAPGGSEPHPDGDVRSVGGGGGSSEGRPL